MAPKAEPKAKAKADAKAKAKGEPKKKAEAAKEDDPTARIPAPDREAFDEKTKAIQDAIDKLQAEQRSITDSINKRSGGKDEFYSKKAELRGQLDEFSQKINALQEKKEAIQKDMGEKRAEGIQRKNDLTKMKKSIGYTSEEDIDQRIASIEFKLWTDTVPLKEEKKLLQEIQELKRNRPKVSQVKKLEGDLSSFNSDSSLSLKEQVKEINEQVRNWLDAKKKVSEKMTELTEGRKAQLGDMPEQIARREKINEEIQAKIKERNDIRDEFRKQEKEFQQALREKRDAQRAKAEEERAKRNAEWEVRRKEREAEKLNEQPHVAEITLIEQTIAFCKSLTATKDKEEKTEKKDTVHNNPEGTVVLGKKDDRDEFWFAPTKEKKSKGKQTKGKEAGAGKPIKHNAVTFALFDQLKLDAPITVDDIPGTLEKLETQMEMYQSKVKDWELKKEEMQKAILEGRSIEEDKDEKAEDKDEKAEEKEGEPAEAKEEEEE
jgi:uncharacterized coiled-coil DUF342 family protein